MGARCRAIREFRGYRVGELADILDVHYTMLSNIEAGRRRISPRLVNPLAEALEIPAAALRYRPAVPGIPAPLPGFHNELEAARQVGRTTRWLSGQAIAGNVPFTPVGHGVRIYTTEQITDILLIELDATARKTGVA